MKKIKHETVAGVHTHTHTHTHTSNLKNKKGITLIALVITIIILLILAGITISQLTKNGLFGKAKQSKEKYENAQIEENELLMSYESKINEYANNKKITTMEEMLIDCGLNTTYTLNDIVENKDGILEKILDNNRAIDYIIDNKEIYLNKICDSENGYLALVNSNNFSKITDNDDCYKEIKDSVYFETILRESNLISLNLNSNENVIYSSEIETHEAYRAFDGKEVYSIGDPTEKTWTSKISPNREQEYIGYNFNRDVLLFGIDYWPLYNNTNLSQNYLSSFTVQGSNNGEDWNDIYYEQNPVYEFAYQKIVFDKPVTYKMYRLNFEETGYCSDVGGYWTTMGEVRFFGIYK